MPAARDDYLLRLIQQAAAALRRLRGRLSGGDDAAQEVAAEAHAVIGELLGTRRELFDRLDPHSAAQLLGDPERVRLWADLLTLRADAVAATGNRDEAGRLTQRSTALRAAVGDQSSAPHSRTAPD